MSRGLLLLLLLLSLAACEEAPDRQLVAADWSCSASFPGHRLLRELSYAEDGSLTGRITIASTQGDPAVEMVFHVQGHWALSGDHLTETLSDQTLMRLRRGGQNLPLTALAPGTIPQMEARLKDEPWAFEITAISAEAMELRGDAGQAFTCHPAG